jgi:hypothetical protein
VVVAGGTVAEWRAAAEITYGDAAWPAPTSLQIRQSARRISCCKIQGGRHRTLEPVPYTVSQFIDPPWLTRAS